MGVFWAYLETEGPSKAFICLWLVANVIVFVVNWHKYAGDEFAFLRGIVGNGLLWARGAANVLNLNSALILLPVCRNFVHWSRGCFRHRRSIRRVLDGNLVFHKYCGWALCAGTVVHVVAHIFNVKNIVASNGGYSRVSADQGWGIILFGTVPGFTGVLVTLTLIFMVSTATEPIRRSYFELFWYTHHLFILFYGALLFHGYAGFIESQTNYPKHPFGCDEPGRANCTVVTCGVNNCCPCDSQGNVEPIETKAGGPGTWMWLVAPLVLYFFERLYRLTMSLWRPIRILKVIKHPDSTPVLQLVLEKFPTMAGQYVFLNVPAISQTEWHPYTLTSCPEMDTVNVHIRVCGDWTVSLAEAVGLNCCTFKLKPTGRWPHRKDVFSILNRIWLDRPVEERNIHVLVNSHIQVTSADAFFEDDLERLRSAPEVQPESVTVSETLVSHLLPTVAVDGPFGTASEDMYRFKTVVLVGAGIGVTPFASLLQALYFRLAGSGLHGSCTQKVYFFWLCAGFDAWSWFATLLMDLEDKLQEHNLTNFLDIRVHMTRGWSENDASNLMLTDRDGENAIVRDEESGRALKAPMQFGRPRWVKVFDATALNAPPASDVGVFSCGPRTLSVELQGHCRDFTAKAINGTRFFFHKENF